MAGKSMKPGGGGRFAALKAKLARKGNVTNPGAVAAAIGRKKYGHKKFQAMAAHGKRRAAASHPRHNTIRGLGGEVKRPATRSHKQGHSFAENLTGKRYR
jgi:hypothetical protein